MTVPLCIRQGSKRNDDSVSVEELDWSAEGQVLIPSEHLWCDFKCRPWAKNSSPNPNNLYIYYMDKSTGTPTSFDEKNVLPNCGNKYGNIIHILKTNCISTSVATVLKCIKWLYPYVQVIGVWWYILYQCLDLKSHQRCSARIRTCRLVKFFHTDWIIISLLTLPYKQRHCYVRIEKGPVQTVSIKLEAQNSLEYHYMLKK